jgi:subtilase family serine protease
VLAPVFACQKAPLPAANPPQFHPTFVRYQPPAHARDAVNGSPAFQPYYMPGGGYPPDWISHAYGFNLTSFGSTAADGTGQTIAIIDAYNEPTITSDLAYFDSYFGLPNPSLQIVNQTGGTSLPPADANWGQEIALDVEWAHAMAPGADILLVEASSAAPANLLAAVAYAASQPGVSVISMSWGGAEFGGENFYDSTFTTPNGHTGVTFLAST